MDKNFLGVFVFIAYLLGSRLVYHFAETGQVICRKNQKNFSPLSLRRSRNRDWEFSGMFRTECIPQQDCAAEDFEKKQGRRLRSCDKGRDKGLNLAPPSEPDRRISRIRLSSQWVRRFTIVRVHSCSAAKDSSLRRANHSFGQR